ncbi:MAG: POTRA domain-containing protein, partial [Planctomycetota bacterium]
MLCGGAVAVAALILLPAGAAKAQIAPKTAIVDVRVEGNETIPAAVILQHTSIKSGRVVTDHELLEDVRSLYRTKWFSRVKREVRTTPEGPVVVFLVKELPEVASVQYRGNEKVSDAQLAKVTGLEPGSSPYRVMFNQDAAEQIRRYYVEQGYRHAKVRLARGDQPEHRDVIFQIEEGPRVRVAKVSFAGNKSFSSAVLKRDLTTKTKLLGVVGIFNFGLFDPQTVPEDEAILTDYYRDLGFFDVKVEANVSESDDRSNIFVRFDIEEGLRYRVRNITLEGNDKLGDDVLLPPGSGLLARAIGWGNVGAKLQPGDYYNARFLQADRRQMEELYGAEGRLFTKILPAPEFLDEPGLIDLKYVIEEDKVRYIRHINAQVLGDHPHTQRALIHNQMLVSPGDKADPTLLNKSRSRIGSSPQFGADLEFTVVPVEDEPIVSEPILPAGGFRGQSPDPVVPPQSYLAPRPAPCLPVRREALRPRPQPLVDVAMRTASRHAVAEPRVRSAPPTPATDPSGWVAGQLFAGRTTDTPPRVAPTPRLAARPSLPPAWTPSVPRFDGPSEAPITQITPRLKTPRELGFYKPVYRAQSPAPQPGSQWEPAPIAEPIAPQPWVENADAQSGGPADESYDPFKQVVQSGFEGQGTANPLLPQSPFGGPFQGNFNEPPPFEEPPGFVDIDVRAR